MRPEGKAFIPQQIIQKLKKHNPPKRSNASLGSSVKGSYMKTQMQQKLEALGFSPLPIKNKVKQVKKTNKQSLKPINQLSVVSTNNQNIKKSSGMTESEAKKIIKASYKNTKSSSDPRFCVAVRKLTKENSIMTIEVAKRTVIQWCYMDSRVYRKDYAIAVLMLSGIWIPPKKLFKEGMSNQIKARCERRDINGSYKSSWVFKK